MLCSLHLNNCRVNVSSSCLNLSAGTASASSVLPMLALSCQLVHLLCIACMVAFYLIHMQLQVGHVKRWHSFSPLDRCHPVCSNSMCITEPFSWSKPCSVVADTNTAPGTSWTSCRAARRRLAASRPC